MNGIDKLWRGYRRFRQDRYPQQKGLFSKLAKNQNPGVMVIACADSRADPSMIFSAAPGELFVVRNVANLVPPYEEEGTFHGTAAALEFAVDVLKVSDIVVMGHASCGGIDACLGVLAGRPTGRFIAPWVGLLDQLRDQLLKEQQFDSPEKLQLAMEQAAVGQSLAHIETYPFAKLALAEGRLQLHGAWFSIASGQLHWRDEQHKHFMPVPLTTPDTDHATLIGQA